MTYTCAQPTTHPARASGSIGVRNLMLVVAIAIIFAPVGLIVLSAA